MENATKNGSGAPDKAPFGWFNQRTWRTVGTSCLAISAGMAWWGVAYLPRSIPVFYFSTYWLIVFLALLIACYMALLDIRYLRLQMALEERMLLKDALGEEAIRAAIQEHQEATQARQNRADPGGPAQ